MMQPTGRQLHKDNGAIKQESRNVQQRKANMRCTQLFELLNSENSRQSRCHGTPQLAQCHSKFKVTASAHAAYDVESVQT